MMQPQPTAVASPLVLCDRLISLAEDVDRAGLRGAARHLLDLAHEVLAEPAQAIRPAA